jgi:hypothetical protein
VQVLSQRQNLAGITIKPLASLKDIALPHNDLFGKKDTLINVSKDTLVSGLEDMPDSKYIRYCDKSARLIAYIAELGLPEPGQQMRLVTRRNFNAMQFLQYIAEREVITDLKLVIYSINAHAAKLLVELIDSDRILNCQILMSNLRNKAHRDKEQITKDMFINHPRIDLFFASSHAKVFSCATEQGNHYTVEGSGNMSYNSRVEQYVVDNDIAMFQFTCQWIADIKEFLKDKKESLSITK